MGGAGSAIVGGELVKDTTTATFMKDVVEGSRDGVVLIDFWAPWCGPCKQLTPVLEKLVREAGGRVKLVKMNIDEHPTIPGQMGIKSIPTVYAFKDGKPLDGFQGAQSESQIKEFILRVVGDEDGGVDLQAAIDAAEEAAASGDAVGAAEIYATILQEDAQHVGALAGLANCYLKSGDGERASQTLALVPPDKQSSPVVTAVRAAIDLAAKAAAAGDLGELQAKVAANGDDLQARYDLALAMGASGGKAGAVEQLIEIMHRKRDWNDDAARKQLLQFFEAWGHGDRETVNGRRLLSAVLFA